MSVMWMSISLNKGNMSILTLHDLSSEFDTINHYTVFILTLDLLILSFNGFHLFRLIVHGTSLYIIIVLFLLLYIQVILSDKFLVLCFSICILSLCLPLLTHTLSYTINLLMTYNYRCLLPLTKYPGYFTLYSHV